MSAATSAAAMPHIVIMFSVRKSVVSPPLYYIQHGGDSTAYECAAKGCYYGGNYTAELFLRAVFYLGKLCVVDGKLFIHEFHLRDHFCYVFVLLVYFTRDFFELLDAMRIALRACAYFGNEPFVYYVITSVSVM